MFSCENSLNLSYNILRTNIGKGSFSQSRDPPQRVLSKIEAEERRDALNKQYRREEVEKNREHNLKIAEIYARAFASVARNESTTASSNVNAAYTHSFDQFTLSRSNIITQPMLVPRQPNYSNLTPFNAPSSTTPGLAVSKLGAA